MLIYSMSSYRWQQEFFTRIVESALRGQKSLMRWLITYSSAQPRSMCCAERWAWQIAGPSWVLWPRVIGAEGLTSRSNAATTHIALCRYPFRAGVL